MAIFDICVIGAGVSGVFACHRILEKKKDLKVILFDIGRPPMKRRLQMFGFGGLLPNSDGKLYLSDTKRVANIVGDKKAKIANDWVISVLSKQGSFDTIKDDGPTKSLKKRLSKIGYKITPNPYIQIFSSHIHGLLKFFADEFDNNIEFAFDKEIVSISKSKGVFCLSTNDAEYKCKRVIIATGRSGWRWAADVFDKFGLVEDNSKARYGVRIEMPADNLKDLNKSNCSMSNDKIDVGPFSWNGTVVPEDHYDMAIASFRSNEDRWKSDKVSFNFIGNIPNKNGFEETDRIGKLTFLLANDRVAKERVSAILNNKSKILSVLPDYDWLRDDIKEFSKAIPEINKGYFYVPALAPLPPTISLGTNLSTEVAGLFVAGENTGITGLLSAAETGMIVADACIRGL
jgi:uncharacterized FAD-dependent dehydrogenase